MPSPRSHNNKASSRDVELVLADRFPIFLDGLKQAFRVTPGFKVLTCCDDGDEALNAVRVHRPQILVLGLDITGKDALGILQEVVAQKTAQTRVVLLAEHVSDEQMAEATRLGAMGVFLRHMDRGLLVQCVRDVSLGKTWLERVRTAQEIDRLFGRTIDYREAAEALTKRQFELFRLVVSGRSTKEIADNLTLSQGTVKSHLHRVYQKLGVRGRLALTLYAREKGLTHASLQDRIQRRSA